MRKTCGICHAKSIEKSHTARQSSVPAAAQPITGGSAPAVAPMKTLACEMRFNGV